MPVTTARTITTIHPKYCRTPSHLLTSLRTSLRRCMAVY